MNVIEVPEKNIRKEYPSTWRELTDQQFEFVMQNWLKLMDGKINIHEFYLIVLYRFLDIKRSPLHNLRDKRLSEQQLEEKFANLWQLTHTLHWLVEEYQTDKGTAIRLSFTDTTNHLPEIINDGDIKLIGPANGLLDITFGEYRRAWAHFAAFGEKREDIYLNRLIATLYRPEKIDFERLQHLPDFDGQRREKFNQNLTQHYTELLQKVPFWQKYSIFLWFFNCDTLLKTGELELDEKPISFQPLFKKTDQPDDVETLDENDLGMTSLLYSIAESKLFGTIADVDNTNYIDVLTALLYWQQQADKIKGNT